MIDPAYCKMSDYWALLEGQFTCEVSATSGDCYRLTWFNERRELKHVWLTGPFTPFQHLLRTTRELRA